MATIQEQETVRRARLRLMSDLSQEEHAAGWLIGWGPALWTRVQDGTRLSPDELTDLRTLSAMEWNARYRAIREGAA